MPFAPDRGSLGVVSARLARRCRAAWLLAASLCSSPLNAQTIPAAETAAAVPSVGAPSEPGPSPPPPSRPAAPSAAEPAPTHEAAPRSDGALSGDPDLDLRYVLDAVRISGNTRTSERVIRRYLPFTPGDVLDVDDPRVLQTRYRLLGTGFFKEVSLRLERGQRRGHVILVVHVSERNTLVLNDLWMGLAASADTDGEQQSLSTFAGVDAAETNLVGSGITLGGATAFSEDQWALAVRFLDPAFSSSRWMLSSEVLYNDALGFFGNSQVRWDDPEQVSAVPRQAVVTYKRLGTTLRVGTDLSVSSQLWFNYRLEGIYAHTPNAAVHEYGGQIEPIDFHILPGRSLLSSASCTVSFDTRDRPLLPTQGVQAAFDLELSAPPLGSDYSFQKLDLYAARWWQLKNQHVVMLEGSLGMISGRAPFFEQYYIGDLSDFRPGRVLGLAFDDRPAPNFLGTSIAEIRYGDYSASINTEYRVPLYRGRRSVLGIDLFGRFGVLGLASDRDLERPPSNRRGFSSVPIDLTAGLGFRMDTTLGGFAFSFSNVLGFIPTGGTR